MADNLEMNTPDTSRYQDDEISLVDLWLTLSRHRKLILGIVGSSLLVGLLWAFLKPPQYEYRVSIEIGNRWIKDEVRPIEEPDTALAKLKESYIPSTLRTSSRVEKDRDIEIEAQIPKKSEIIVLTAKGTEDEGDMLKGLLVEVVDKLRADHQRIYSILKKDIELRQRDLENELSSLKDEANLVEADRERLKERRELLKAEISELQRLISSTEAQYKRATAKPGGEANAMTLLLLDSEARTARARQSDLQDRMQITIAGDEDRLVKKLADNQRKQAEMKERMAKLDLELLNFRETNATDAPMRSIKPVGPRKALVLVLALFGGFFLGIFAAFFAEFLNKVKEQQQAVSNG